MIVSYTARFYLSAELQRFYFQKNSNNLTKFELGFNNSLHSLNGLLYHTNIEKKYTLKHYSILYLPKG